MPQINRTIIVERDSRELTTRVIEALDGYDAVAQSAADAAASAADAVTAADSATTAANAAQTAAADALQATKLTYLDVPTLLDSQDVLSVGDRILTRTEVYSYEVVADEPRLLTAGGTGLRPLPRDGAITALQCAIPTSGDQTTLLQSWIQWATNQGHAFDLAGQTFTMSKMSLTGDVKLRNGTLISNKTVAPQDDYLSDYAIRIAGTSGATVNVVSDFEVGGYTLELASTAGIEKGDLLALRSTRLIDTDHRGGWQEGQIVKVDRVSGNLVRLVSPLSYSGRANLAVTGTIVGISADRYTINLSNVPGGLYRDKAGRVTITSGAAAGAFRYPIEYSGSNIRHSGNQPGEWDRGAWPAGVQVGDSYEYAWRSTVLILKPARPQITDLTLTRELVTTATEGDLSFRGLRLVYTDGAVVKDCRINNFAMTNIHLWRSFRPRVENCDLSGANHSHNEFDGTGYGCSIEACAEATARNNFGSNCRRLIDYSGSSGYSNDGICEGNRALGGGTTYAGVAFFPIGTARQSVCGSHGSGRFTRYLNNTGTDVYSGINLRGRGEVCHGFESFGYAEYLFQINHGAGHTLDGLTYTDKFSEVDRNTDGRWVVSTKAGKRLISVGRIDFDGGFTGNMMSTIRNVSAQSVQRSGIVIETTAAAIRNLVLENWHLVISNEGSDYTDFDLLRGSPSATLDRCYFSDLKFTMPVDVDYSGIETVIDIPLSYEIAESGRIKIDDWWVCRIPADSVIRLPHGGQTAILDMVNVSSGDRPRCFGFMIAADSATPIGSAYAVNVEATAVQINTGAGITAGAFGFHLDQEKRRIDIANATTVGQTVRLRVS